MHHRCTAAMHCPPWDSSNLHPGCLCVSCATGTSPYQDGVKQATPNTPLAPTSCISPAPPRLSAEQYLRIAATQSGCRDLSMWLHPGWNVTVHLRQGGFQIEPS